MSRSLTEGGIPGFDKAYREVLRHLRKLGEPLGVTYLISTIHHTITISNPQTQRPQGLNDLSNLFKRKKKKPRPSLGLLVAESRQPSPNLPEPEHGPRLVALATIAEFFRSADDAEKSWMMDGWVKWATGLIQA